MSTFGRPIINGLMSSAILVAKPWQLDTEQKTNVTANTISGVTSF